MPPRPPCPAPPYPPRPRRTDGGFTTGFFVGVALGCAATLMFFALAFA